MAALMIAAVLLTSCGGANTPEKVMTEFKQAVSDIKSGDMTADIEMKGDENGETVNFDADLDIKFDRRDKLKTKTAIGVTLKGDANVKDSSFSGELELDTRFIDNGFYVNLKNIKSNDDKLKQMEPLINLYKNKWLKIAKEMLPQNLQNLQGKSEEDLEKEEKITKLFVSTKMFNVVKDHGVEDLNGKKVHHYDVELNEEGLKKYAREAGIISGKELTEQEIEESAEIGNYLKKAELWIGTKDSFPYKAVIVFEEKNKDDDKMDMEMTLKMEGNSFNVDVVVEAPKDAEDFNPFQLMMGGGMPTGAPSTLPELEDVK